MNRPAHLFLLVNVTALITLPRRWAAPPLLTGACYMPLGQGINVGPFSLTILRLLVLADVRLMVRRERPT
jgi:hypothetical protein